MWRDSYIYMAVLNCPQIILPYCLEQIGPKWDSDYKKFYVYENSNVLSRTNFIRILFSLSLWHDVWVILPNTVTKCQISSSWSVEKLILVQGIECVVHHGVKGRVGSMAWIWYLEQGCILLSPQGTVVIGSKSTLYTSDPTVEKFISSSIISFSKHSTISQKSGITWVASITTQDIVDIYTILIFWDYNIMT